MTLDDAGYPLPNLILMTETTMAELADLIRKNSPGCVLIAIHCELGAMLFDGLKREGLSCPRDYRIIAFDDPPQYAHYGFSVVANPKDETGRILAKLACGQICDIHYVNRTSIRLIGKFIRRKTF